MPMYAVKYHCARTAFSSPVRCTIGSLQLLSSAAHQENYSRLLICELRRGTQRPKQKTVKFREEIFPNPSSPGWQARKCKPKLPLEKKETVDSSVQHHFPSVTHPPPLPDRTEQHLRACFAEFANPSPSVSDSITPVSSLLSMNQSIPKSTSILRSWFRELDLNALIPHLPQSGNLAPYVYSSYTLSQMVRLGVDLSKLESVPGAANMLVKLDFHQSIEPVIWKLHGHGFSLEQIARLFTVFPKVLQLSSEEIDTRIGYFLQHNFVQADVVQMFFKHPTILELSPVDVDRQLASIQTVFQLSADELRKSVVAVPKLILHPLGKTKDIYVVLSKMMGFSNEAVRQMVCQNATLLVTERDRLAQNFMFMHSRLNLPLERIQQWSTVLSSAPHLLSQRATFLVRRGLFQSDPTKPLYTPLSEVVNGDDAQFCERFGLVDEDQYNVFLKTL